MKISAKKDDVKWVDAVRKKRALLFSNVGKAKVRMASLDPVEAETPADTKLLKINEKEVEVPTMRVLTYANFHPMFRMLRKKRDVAKLKMVSLADGSRTPASTALLKWVHGEHSVVMPSTRMMYII